MNVEWAGVDKENTWEDLAKIWDATLQFVKSELRKLGLKRGVRTQLKQPYGFTLCPFEFRLSWAEAVLDCFDSISSLAIDACAL